MLVWKIFVFILILGNVEAKCSKNGWKKIKKTIKDCIDKYIEDMKVINNNEKASFAEVLDKTKSEIVKSHGGITKTFKKFCKGKNKKKDKKKLKKNIEKAFKKKISQLVTLIGDGNEQRTIDRMIPLNESDDTILEVQDRSSNAMDCPDEKSSLYASNLEKLTWNCEACWAKTDQVACSSFVGSTLENYIEGSCLIHDNCYKSSLSKNQCENQFYYNIRAQCRQRYSWYSSSRAWCYGLATTIYYASGLSPFHTAYSNGQKSGKTCERFRKLVAIRNRWSGKVLEYDSYRMKAKTKDGRLDQLWYLSDYSGGYYNIRSVKYPKKSIEYSSSSRLRVTSYNKYSSRQKWKFNSDGTVVSKYSGRKMYTSSSSSGATVTTSSSSSSSSKLKWDQIYPSSYGKSPYFP